MTRCVVVVGGGVIGCTTALRLAEAGCTVTLLEAAPVLGGLASSWTFDVPHAPSGGVTWDRFYHVILGSDTAWRGVLAELGLDESIVWSPTRTGASADGAVRSVSSPLDLLRFRPLSPLSRVRVGLTVLVASRLRDGRALETRPLEPWLRKWSGDAAFERFWLPQLRAKLGDNYTDVSVAFVWATAQRLLRARRSGLGDERFGYVPGGYAAIMRRYCDALIAAGVKVRTGTSVETVQEVAPGAGDHGVRVCLSDGESIDAHDVVMTVSARAITAMVPTLTAAERTRLAAVRYQGVVCVSLLLRRPLSAFYLTYLMNGSILTGVVDMSSLVQPVELADHGLVYLPRYQSPTDPLFDASDIEITEKFVAALQVEYPSFNPVDVVASKVARAREVFAVPTLGYSAAVPRTRTSIGGVWLITSAQIEQATLNVDESVRVAERGVQEVLRG